QATAQYDFSATATVTWDGGARHTEVEVRNASGSVEIVSADRKVIDDGRHTYVSDPKAGRRWTGLFVEPIAEHGPSPASHWELSTKPGPKVAGRATTVVLATRPDGTQALRLFVDD